MSTRRFEIIPVVESVSAREREESELVDVSAQIKVENELSVSSSTNQTRTSSQISFRNLGQFFRRNPNEIRRRASIANICPTNEKKLSKILSSSFEELAEAKDEKIEPQATVYETYFLTPTDKFFQELRAKRRELMDKAKNLSIEQRIAFNRREHPKKLLRAQDIFSVHFERDDDDDYFQSVDDENFFTEQFQDQIRTDIYNELNRKRVKQYKKQFRNLLFARSLMFFMLSLIIFMSFTLIYVVSQVYRRAKHLEGQYERVDFLSEFQQSNRTISQSVS